MTIEEMKKWVDQASYEQLLERWRMTPVGSHWFQSDTGIGAYYEKAMKKAREKISHDEQVRISKIIGYQIGDGNGS